MEAEGREVELSMHITSTPGHATLILTGDDDGVAITLQIIKAAIRETSISMEQTRHEEF